MEGIQSIPPGTRVAPLGLELPYPTTAQREERRLAEAAGSAAGQASTGDISQAAGAGVIGGAAVGAGAALEKATGQTQQPQAAAQRKPKPKKAKAPAKPRTPPLPLGERFRIAEAIKAASATETDVELAARISPTLTRPITGQLVGKYREELGLKSVKEMTKAEYRAKLAEAERMLIEARQSRLPLGDGGVPGSTVDQVAGEAKVQVLGGASVDLVGGSQ